MFKDYYKILEIPFEANALDIKDAYRKQALKWHPDKHPNMDVKSIMQDINEAYAILKDPAKRARYDKEYAIFKNDQSPKTHHQDFSHSNKQDSGNHNGTDSNNTFKQDYNYDYNVKDENLKDDIKDARDYANKLVDDFYNSFKHNVEIAATGAWEGVKWYICSFIILIIIGCIIRACAQ